MTSYCGADRRHTRRLSSLHFNYHHDNKYNEHKHAIDCNRTERLLNLRSRAQKQFTHPTCTIVILHPLRRTQTFPPQPQTLPRISIPIRIYIPTSALPYQPTSSPNSCPLPTPPKKNETHPAQNSPIPYSPSATTDAPQQSAKTAASPPSDAR